jgi:hypothetical protein
VSSPLLSTSQKDPEESPLGPVARLETETAGNAWKRRANAWKRLEHPPKTYFFGSHVSPGGVQRLFGSDGGGSNVCLRHKWFPLMEYFKYFIVTLLTLYCFRVEALTATTTTTSIRK